MEGSRNHVTDELLAAFLDGNVSLEEADMVASQIYDDPRLREILAISDRVDEAMETYQHDKPYLPMTECAAVAESNLCDFQCEVEIMSKCGITYEESFLAREARENRWLRDAGTPLYVMGKLMEANGLYVKRQYDSTLDELRASISSGEYVIAVTDGEILDGKNQYTDDGRCDYHAVVCKRLVSSEILLYNPLKEESETSYPIEVFLDAWNEAGAYMVRVKKEAFEYEPRPLKLDDVMIDADLLDLREAIAENAHEVWAAGRKKEGWTYGTERDDQKKLHPDMIAYSELTDSEKQYDRDMAISTIKLVKKLGFDIVPQNKQRHRCPGCGALVSKAHVYCSQCGVRLSNDIFAKK